MAQQKIKRRIVDVDTSNQLSLFADLDLDASAVETPAQPVSPVVPNFNAPDPHSILLNQVPLHAHLKRAGQTAPLKVRKMLQGLDWEAFESAYPIKGRPPYAPSAMMGLILFGIMKGISSLRDLEGFARTDLGCMWVTGGIAPDHSVIGRFIQRHEAILSAGFFDTLTRQVLKETGSTTEIVAGDGSIIEAAASRFHTVRSEALTARLEEEQQRQAEEPTEAGAKRVALLQQAEQIRNERQEQRQAKGKRGEVQINCQEPEAVLQPQKDKKRFAPSYKPSVLANEVRVIVGMAVDASSETQVVDAMLEQAAAHGPITKAMFDAGYFCQSVIEQTEARDIELLCPEGQSQGGSWTKQSDKYYPKSQFHYFPEHDAYRCPAGALLTPTGRYSGNAKAPGYVSYGTDTCSNCQQRSACTKAQGGRQIKRYASDDAKDAQRLKMRQPEARAQYVKRQAMVEPVFSQLRYRQGLNRFRRKGLAAVRLEFTLHAMAYNLSRLVALAGHLSAYLGLWKAVISRRAAWIANRGRFGAISRLFESSVAVGA